jgi:hypothetical protein
MVIYLILVIVGILVLSVFTYFLARKSNAIKTALNIVYLVAIVVLAYFLFMSIDRPIKFEKAKKVRYDETIRRLKRIKDTEFAFKSNYGKYTGSLDSLLEFAKHDSLVIIKAVGMVPDSLALKYSSEEAEKIALKAGIITRDTVKVSILDSLFKDMTPEEMIMVPTTNSRFELAAGTIETVSKTTESVFEAKAHNDVILSGLDRQLVVNLNDERTKNDKYPGLKVGSLTEVVTSGNWE